jgi:hypothetical protein
MQLSTAIALGRTLGPMWTRDSQTGNCAMMAAGLAANSGKWNWRDNLNSRKEDVELPCSCSDGPICDGPFYSIVSRFASLISQTIHLFNHHVVWRGDWTLDRLIDWVRSVEPPDPYPQVPAGVSSEKRQLEEIVQCT